MRTGPKAFFIHFFVTVFFIVAALAYFSPVLQGKILFQNDIAQYTGMAKEQNDFRKRTGEEPYWTNSAFGGMPTYQLGAYYPHNYVKKLDSLIRFLPRPADYLFLYFIGFYILLCCMQVDYRLAVIGALAFGFSTYLIIIFGAGHNAKAHAMGYLPMVLGGIILVFRKKYLWGFLLTALAMALEVQANHYQMTYYFMLLVLILGGVYLYDAVKRKQLKHYWLSVLLLSVAVGLGIAANATGLMATKEYADWSTRGKSELTIGPDGETKENTEGLSRAYITQWSYGIAESLNLYVPRLFGGASNEDLGKDSKTYAYLVEKGLPRNRALEFAEGLPLYWGEQPGTSGPAYIGAVIFFLFFLGLFVVKKKAKWWLLGGTVLSLFMSWGKNFSLFTDFMIDYFPLYDKFRAVSSAQVVLELCAPVLAVLALVALFDPQRPTTDKLKALRNTFLGFLGLTLVLFVFKGSFDFESLSDENLRITGMEELPDMIRADRQSVYMSDLFRSILFVFLATAVLWFHLKGKLRKLIAIVILGLLIVIDLVGVNLRYVSHDDFVSKRRMTQPFQETAVDQRIMEDPGTFRVFDPSEGFDSARTAYFHQSIVGYHAAKPAGMQDLFDFYLYRGNFKVLNMLNVKYVLQQDEEGRSYAGLNPDALGNAWFVSKLKEVKSADEEILALETLDMANEAVVNTSTFKNINRFNFQTDSTTTITLTAYEPNHLTYTSKNDNAGVAVFSEMYYGNGWQAYVDGKPQDHFRVNYVLRALKLPAGEHTVEFKFEPEVVQTGSMISLASSIILVLVLVGGVGFSFWRARTEKKERD